MPDNEIGVRRLNYEIPSELEADYVKCASRQRMAAAAAANGDMVKASDLLKINLEWCKRHLSTDPIHPMTLWHLAELGSFLVGMGRFSEAIIYVGEAYDISEAIDPLGQDTLNILARYAQALVGNANLALAAGLYETLWDKYKKAFGEQAEATLEKGRQAARCWFRAAVDERAAEAEKKKFLSNDRRIQKQLLAAWESKEPGGSIHAIETRADLAINYATLREYSTAQSMFQQCIAALSALEGKKDQQHKKQAVEKLCRDWLHTIQVQLGPDPAVLRNLRKEEAKSVSELGREAEAKAKKQQGPETGNLGRTAPEIARRAEPHSYEIPRGTNMSPRSLSTGGNGLTKTPAPGGRMLDGPDPPQARPKSAIIGPTSLGDDLSQIGSRVRQSKSCEDLLIGDRPNRMEKPVPKEPASAQPRHGKENGRNRASSIAAMTPLITVNEPSDQRHRKSRSNPPTESRARGLEAEPKLGGNVVAEQLREKLKEATPKFETDGPRIPQIKIFGSFCDATQQLGGDAGVDFWFADIKRINEEIFRPYRRQAGKGVKVGILDTGIDMKNMAFKDDGVRQRIKKRFDFCDPSGKGNARDQCGHGTHCVALINRIAPAADLYIGRVALDFDSGLDEEVVAKFLDAQAIRVALGSKGPGEDSKNWDVDILSLSLGFQHFSEAIEAALRSSVRKGKIVLAAASNNGTLRAMAYPAWDPNVIPINSANSRGRPSDFNPPATAGKTLTVLGENVRSAWITTTTTRTTIDTTGPGGIGTLSESATAAVDLAATRHMSGTSVATPIAAGIVALLLELAMIEVPDDPVTQATLRDVLPHLKRQAGLTELLMRQAAETGDFHNIVPTNLLNPNLTVGENAAVIKGILARKFRFDRGVLASDGS
ncbi:peptidase S8/S53 domain-containing protein [Achaetomium macrosporum]|uniref:Peptidase S8/S53 domain-containing protein n=1 Tax=Achaetomium macrosporum TaxID=79813 RepID=A0AAN7C624_9PEZI|nr:peptidase S8/S53 domain-containing protein [Achaetomium macrosporum]